MFFYIFIAIVNNKVDYCACSLVGRRVREKCCFINMYQLYRTPVLCNAYIVQFIMHIAEELQGSLVDKAAHRSG